MRKRWVVLGVALAVLGIGASVFIVLWNGSGAHDVPLSVAVNRFRPGGAGASGASGATGAAGSAAGQALRPAQGVYSYTGSGSEHLSVPPKTQSEGPVIPGTVTYLAHGCWLFRLDYSDRHWQDATYCRHGPTLLEPAQAGWYNWDFVVFSEADTATFTCGSSAVAVPAARRTGVQVPFRCSGHNDHLSTGRVTMNGWVEYLASGHVTVEGHQVDAVEVRQESRLSGGQTGENTADTWFATSTGLPLEGSWTSNVRTPTPIGTSTLSASGHFQLTNLKPQT